MVIVREVLFQIGALVGVGIVFASMARRLERGLMAKGGEQVWHLALFVLGGLALWAVAVGRP